MIKGKSPEEIRKTFNIQNDFTPEEEDQIRRENEWAEEYETPMEVFHECQLTCWAAAEPSRDVTLDASTVHHATMTCGRKVARSRLMHGSVAAWRAGSCSANGTSGRTLCSSFTSFALAKIR